MKKILLFAVLLCIGAVGADGALRDKNTVNRSSGASSSVTTATENRAATTNVRTRPGTASQNTSRNITNRATGTTTGAARTGVSRRDASATTTRAAHTTTRTATRNTVRTKNSTTTARTATSGAIKSSRGTTTNATRTNSVRAAATRAAATTGAMTQKFSGEYNTCRDAYFTCMDQFCAYANETYRRCVCSSRLTDVQNRERALSQSATQLQDFKDLNIEVISKTAAETKAMLNETAGEAIAAANKDKSDSAKQLAGISAILSDTKTKSTGSNNDIAGNIDSIWATTDFTSSANLSELTGESLYNAVHAQCAEIVADACGSTSTMSMVTSAYGMYIENDCANVLANLDKNLTSANTAIRQTEREMMSARLENYNVHNSTAINECIAQVRKDITATNACGPNYVHCLDITGKYLNYETGEPIYTADFYQLQHMLSLSGDTLTNATNQAFVVHLNDMRKFASRGLDTCRDISDSVWTEFMRQALVEIYQSQRTRIRQVKEECLTVVNDCYDEQAKQLKDFSNVKEQLLMGMRMETAEEMCAVKMNTCSNLYGDGMGNGLELLLTAMHNITDQKIGTQCHATLLQYVQDICAVPITDTIHKYPYGCRTYAPGNATYAQYYVCNHSSQNTNTTNAYTISETWITENTPSNNEQCWFKPDNDQKKIIYCGTTTNNTSPATETVPNMCKQMVQYVMCKPGYYLYLKKSDGTELLGADTLNETTSNQCKKCPLEYHCKGGIHKPEPMNEENYFSNINQTTDVCGNDYIGSLYQKLVIFATEACTRPSEAEKAEFVLPTDILSDVSSVMDTVRTDLGKELKSECERLGGAWNSNQSVDNDEKHQEFYKTTGANTQWGWCQTATETEQTTTSDTTN